jgi:hypothetical protein
MHRRTCGGRLSLRVGPALFCVTLTTLLAAPRPAPASVPPVGQDAGLHVFWESETGDKLKIREVSVQADVRGGLAATTLTTVFSNSITQQCQASLDLTVPRGAVVTGYAYWFKGERVEAKLLDNERAWEIYQTITSRGRDPAIMEQWSDTNYHLQVYPVEPGKDLRIEVRYVAPLESDARGPFFRLPVAVGENAPTLEKLSARVRFHGVEARRLADSASLTPRASRGGVEYAVERQDWKAADNWLFRIKPEGVRLLSFGQAAASARGSGFFSVVFWPARELLRPQVRVDGALPRSVHQSGFTRKTPAGRRLVLEGRYGRPGSLHVAFRDARMPWTHATLTLPGEPGEAGVPGPKKLWGASEIKALTGSTSTWEIQSRPPDLRRRVVRMSKDFGVVSPYTAWLAVPRSEYEFYLKTKREQARQAKVQTNARVARGGDPLVRVIGTPDIVRVMALLPSGEPIPMTLRGGVWEGRFDLPADTAEGTYQVVVLMERADGRVKRVALSYQIDRRGPAGQALLHQEGDVARVTVTADADTRSAQLLFSDGRRVPLEQAARGHWVAACAPASLQQGPVEVVLIDGAHNVTRIVLDIR